MQSRPTTTTSNQKGRCGARPPSYAVSAASHAQASPTQPLSARSEALTNVLTPTRSSPPPPTRSTRVDAKDAVQASLRQPLPCPNWEPHRRMTPGRRTRQMKACTGVMHCMHAGHDMESERAKGHTSLRPLCNWAEGLPCAYTADKHKVRLQEQRSLAGVDSTASQECP